MSLTLLSEHVKDQEFYPVRGITMTKNLPGKWGKWIKWLLSGKSLLGKRCLPTIHFDGRKCYSVSYAVNLGDIAVLGLKYCSGDHISVNISELQLAARFTEISTWYKVKSRSHITWNIIYWFFWLFMGFLLHGLAIDINLETSRSFLSTHTTSFHRSVTTTPPFLLWFCSRLPETTRH